MKTITITLLLLICVITLQAQSCELKIQVEGFKTNGKTFVRLFEEGQKMDVNSDEGRYENRLQIPT